MSAMRPHDPDERPEVPLVVKVLMATAVVLYVAGVIWEAVK